MVNAKTGDLVMTKSLPRVGFEVDGVGLEFIALRPLQNSNTRYLTHEQFNAMFEVVRGEEN